MMQIGIDLGGTSIRAGLVENGTIVKKYAAPSKADLSEQEIVEHLKEVIRQVWTPDTASIGAGVPSVVDVEKGVVYNVANIPAWKEVHLKKILEDEFHVPVAVNNDSNCFALGQYLYGQRQRYRNMVCITLGTGVGAGVIIDGRLYAGHNTGAGEIGCLPYLKHDYEYYCGSRFFVEEYGVTGHEAYRRSCEGDPLMNDIWCSVGTHIGRLLQAVLFSYDPEAIIIGGSISKAFNFFSKTMNETLTLFPYPKTIERLKIIVSRHEDVALLGASAL